MFSSNIIKKSAAKKRHFFAFFLCLSLWNCATASTGVASNVTLTSPDNKIQLTVFLVEGNVMYSVKYNGNDIILPSAMSITVDNIKIGINSKLGKVKRFNANEEYPTLGVHSVAINHYNGANVDITSAKTPFVIQAKVFNDGLAFRYIIKRNGKSIINKDSTTFNIPSGTAIWSQSNVKYYEGSYQKKRIDDIKTGELAGPPVTMQFQGKSVYAAITEAGLIDFAGMSLISNGKNGYTANLAGVVKKEGNIQTPWRVIEIGNDLNTLVNCDVITNVSPSFDRKIFPNGVFTDWIKPGRSVWSWLADDGTVSLKNMKHFTDLAAELGFEYNLVDEGWSEWKEGSRDQWDLMKELVDYSAKKGVKVWVWKAYPDRKGIAGINTPEKRDTFFKKCKNLGIAGLKIDFFDSEEQEIVDFYQAGLKDAARYQLMINFHGSNKPTGENRTWPNELSREAIRGLENSPPWANGNTTLPFTRFLAGPADFTPVNFTKLLGEVSWAHQVATMVVFTSPFMCLGADPQSVLQNPCKNMIQSIPSTWDQTIVLPESKISELAVYARRKGKTWYLAVLNGKDQPKTINIDLSFLQKDIYYIEEIVDDSMAQSSVVLNSKIVNKKTALKIVMNGEGGYVAKITERL